MLMLRRRWLRIMMEDDARKLYAVSGAGNSVGWDTLLEIYTANEFFAAAKPAGD